MPRRYPRNTTHVSGCGYNAEVYYQRLGRVVRVFAEGRGQWFMTNIKPSELRAEKVRRLTLDERNELT